MIKINQFSYALTSAVKTSNDIFAGNGWGQGFGPGSKSGTGSGADRLPGVGMGSGFQSGVFVGVIQSQGSV